MCDVVVIGGGVIGLSIAYELARCGLKVRVLEQGQLGQEASWAGAGILPPGNPDWAQSYEARLRGASSRLWPIWVQELESLTQSRTGYLTCGGLEVRFAHEAHQLEAEIKSWHAEHVALEPMTTAALRQRFPMLNPEITAGYFLPGLAQVRNPWLLRTLQLACLALQVDLYPGHPVNQLVRNGERVHSVRTPTGEFSASNYVIAAGAWSGELLRQLGCVSAVRPIRGQIVLLERMPLPFTSVIQLGARYLVPRTDGRILVGSTEEDVGFDKHNSVAAVSELLAFAQQVVPALSQAHLVKCWSGLRPRLSHPEPWISRVGNLQNVYVATGHYRAGLLLSPITAHLIRELILGQPLSVSLESP